MFCRKCWRYPFLTKQMFPAQAVNNRGLFIIHKAARMTVINHDHYFGRYMISLKRANIYIFPSQCPDGIKTLETVYQPVSRTFLTNDNRMQLTARSERLLHGANLSRRNKPEAGITVVNRRNGNGLQGHLWLLSVVEIFCRKGRQARHDLQYRPSLQSGRTCRQHRL